MDKLRALRLLTECADEKKLLDLIFRKWGIIKLDFFSFPILSKS
jgi:hypothetical protein